MKNGAEMTDTIKLDSVTKIYKNFTAVNNVSMQIREGEILGLIGHNGAGKTTILKMMVGLLAPTSGIINVMGYDITRDTLREYDSPAVPGVLRRTL